MLEVLTTRGRAFVAAGLTLLASGYFLGFRDLTRIGLLLVALPLLAAGLARRRPPGLVVTRATLPVQVVADQSAQVITTVANTAPRSTPIMLAEERLDYLLGERPRLLLGSLGAGQHRTIRYAVRPPMRGRHTLGPLTVQLRDPFGLTTRFVEVGEPTELLALPRTDPLGTARPRGTGLGADGEIPHMVALHGEDDQSIREYRDGDDLRRIHWPATARTGELMVRQEDRPARRRVVVLLDARVEAHVGAGPGSSFEWAISAIASVVVHFTGLGYAVHLLTPQTLTDGHADVPIDAGTALQGLAVTDGCDTRDFDQSVRAAQGLLAGGGLFVAALAAYDDTALTRVAALRPPGATGLAFVLPGPPPGRGGIDQGGAVQLLLAAGWRATPVRPGDTVPHAWGRLSRTATVGAA
jgi:hypothetical protein